MIYGYIRISTDKQSIDNQRFEIENFALKQNVFIDSWIEETVSSTKDIRVRKLGNLLDTLDSGDVVIASELSRLGRNLFQIMSILHYTLDIGAIIWTIKDNYRLGSDIQSKVLAFAFGLSAEIERNLIAQRTKEALLRLKAEGKILGRPKGSKNKQLKLEKKSELVTRLYSNGLSYSAMAKKLRVHRRTLRKYMDVFFDLARRATFL